MQQACIGPTIPRGSKIRVIESLLENGSVKSFSFMILWCHAVYCRSFSSPRANCDRDWAFCKVRGVTSRHVDQSRCSMTKRSCFDEATSLPLNTRKRFVTVQVRRFKRCKNRVGRLQCVGSIFQATIGKEALS